MKNNGSQPKPTETLKTPKEKIPSYKNGKKSSVLLYIIIIAITLTAITVTIFLGKKNHRETIRLVTEQFNQQQLILARAAAKGIETFIADVDDDLLALSNFPVVQRMEAGILDRMEVLYQGIPPQTSSRRLDKNGILRFIYPNKGWRKELIGRDYSKEPWFQKAKKTGEVVISGLILNEAGKRRMRMVRPVYVKNEKGNREFNGVIICSINPELSYNIINNIRQQMMAGEEGAGRYVSGWHRGEKGVMEKLIAYTPVYVFGKLWSVAVCAPVDEVEKITGKAYSDELYREGFIIFVLTAAGVFSFITVYRRSRILEKEIEIRKQAQERIVHLNAVLQAIRNVNQLIVKVNDRERLLQGACDNLIKTRGYNSARIALIEGDGRFITDAQAGFSNGFSAMVDGLKHGELTQCMRQAVDKSDVVVVADPAVECGNCPMVEIYAGKARLIARLEHEGRIYGFIFVMVSVGMAVDEEERSLFKEIAGDIAFALYNMELEEKRRRAEDALKEVQRYTRGLIEASLDAFVTISAEGKITDVNQATELITGMPRKEIIGTDFSKYFTDPNVASRGYQKVFRDNYVRDYPLEIKHHDGKVTPVLYNASVYKDTQGRVAGVFAAARDITEQKRSEEEIRKLSSAVEQSIDGLAMANLEPRLTYVNNAFARMHGYSLEEMIGMNGVDLAKKEELDKYTDSLNKIKTQGSWTGEIEHIRKDGTFFPAFLSVNLLKNTKGKPTGILAVVKDISEQKKLEAQFRHAQKMEAIGVLAGGVAHDFNNILTIIIGNADMALMNVDKDDPLRERLEEIKIAGERAASLTRQLLSFSRKQIMTPRVLDLNELLTDVKKMLGRLVGEDIKLLTILEPALWPVQVDPGQMEQVIMNLAVNARDAMPTGGNLTIETANMDLDENYFYRHGIEEEKPGNYVMLGVSDTGSGMDKKIQEHIFDPFFTTKEVGKGTGLGLSTVYGIVKQNNGILWVYSEPGQGTTFKVYLPMMKGDVEPEEKGQTPVDNSGGSETVLLVEDDDGLRKLAQNVLQQHGYKVLDAENGEHALRVSQAHEGAIHLMITDVVMPRMGGKEVAERMQPIYPRMKVIYMSGYTDNAIVQHGVLAPGLNFLQKPFSPEGLVHKVREVLDKWGDNGPNRPNKLKEDKPYE